MDYFDASDWAELEARYRVLERAPLSAATAQAWLQQWSDVESQLWEQAGEATSRAHVNTLDREAEAAHLHFLRDIMPRVTVARERLKRRLLALEGYEAPADQQQLMQEFRTEQRLFREQNVPLQTEVSVLASDFRRRVGSLSVEWQGQTLSMDQAERLLQGRDRAEREQLWRRMHERWLQERDRFNQMYVTMLALRRQIAHNAGFQTYRDFAWLDRGRYDYTPADALRFHEAIQQEVVPLASRLYEQRRAALGVATLRPWDLEVEPEELPALAPFTSSAELEAGCARIFDAVDGELGAQFALLRDGHLELDARPNKAPGAYCRPKPASQRSYIFMNAVGKQRNVQTLLHEAGHAFHNQNSYHLPLLWQRSAPMEFAEVASMGMELLAYPYLEREHGGFYDPRDANRARAEHLTKIALFLPYMAVVDAFQQWVYSEAPEALTPADLDATWLRLWRRFMPGVDYAGLHDVEATGWHRKHHIFVAPFYYIEYGLAQVGALQLWRNARHDQPAAVAAYRRALALGGTRPLPELFETAGARLAFDGATLRELMALIEQELAQLKSHAT